jgi:hypothetical protein
VQRYIDYRLNQRASRLELSKEAVIRELANLCHSNLCDYVSWGADENGAPEIRLKPSESLTVEQQRALKKARIINSRRVTKRGTQIEDTVVYLELWSKNDAIKTALEELNKAGSPVDEIWARIFGVIDNSLPSIPQLPTEYEILPNKEKKEINPCFRRDGRDLPPSPRK